MNTYPYFESLYIAVFNCNDGDQRKGRSAVVSAFGKEGWQRVKPVVRKGIMAIFKQQPTPEFTLYAETVGKSSDARRCAEITAGDLPKALQRVREARKSRRMLYEMSEEYGTSGAWQNYQNAKLDLKFARKRLRLVLSII